VDIAIPWATNRYSLISVFEQAGYHLSGTVIAQVDTECMQLTFVSESLKVPVDVFFARKNGEKIEIGLDYEPPLIWHLNPFKLTTQQYFSCNFLVPDPPDVVLCQLYGPDWKTPQHYDPLLLSPALLGVLHPAAIARSYNNLVELLKNKNWKKAISYVKQIQSVHDDSLLVELKNHLINEDLEG
jgi:hypothetical protein